MLACHFTDILLYSSWIQNLCPFFRISRMVDGDGRYLLNFLNLNDFKLNCHIKAFLKAPKFKSTIHIVFHMKY